MKTLVLLVFSNISLSFRATLWLCLSAVKRFPGSVFQESEPLCFSNRARREDYKCQTTACIATSDEPGIREQMHHSLTKVWGVGVGVWVPFQRPDVSQVCLKLVQVELAGYVVHWRREKGCMPTPWVELKAT